MWKPVSEWCNSQRAAEKAIAARFADWETNPDVLRESGVHFGKWQYRFSIREEPFKPTPADRVILGLAYRKLKEG